MQNIRKFVTLCLMTSAELLIFEQSVCDVEIKI
jgi:hypothetical protein